MLFVPRTIMEHRWPVSRSRWGLAARLLWLAMRFCGVLKRILRDRGVELLTRISGRLLSVIAVQLVAGSARAFVEQGSGGSAAWRRG